MKQFIKKGLAVDDSALVVNGYLYNRNGEIIVQSPDLTPYLTDAPSDTKTYGRKDGAWSEVSGGSGTTDHSALSNLDYAHAGHTGFEPAKGVDDNYVTGAEKTKLSNLSGTNTGDETATRIASINHGATEKTSLVDADEITGQDSANSFSLIRTTWTNVKAFLKTYFDTLYVPLLRTTVSGTTQQMARNTSYLSTGSAKTTFTLPAVADSKVGDFIDVISYSASGFVIAQNANQLIHVGNQVTATGTGGYIQNINSTPTVDVYSQARLICIKEYNVSGPVYNEWILVSPFTLFGA